METFKPKYLTKTYTRRKRSSDYVLASSPKRARLADDDDEGDRHTSRHLHRDRSESSPSSASSSPHPQSHYPQSTVSSDPPPQPSTPPSSPPGFPWERSPHKDEPRTTAISSAFSALKRKPLSSVADNARKPQKRPPTNPGPKTPKPLVQMQINLGGPVHKICKTCGMEYVPSSMEDMALHKKFHAQSVGGVDLGKEFVKSARSDALWTKGEEGVILVVDRGSKLGARRRARAVLDVVQKELGAVDIGDEELWSRIVIASPQSLVQASDGVEEAGKEERLGSRYKAYLFVQGTRCVGLCLAERIQYAHRVIGEEPSQDGREDIGGGPRAAQWRAISISTTTEPAVLGISRIWTSSTHRKKRIATTLLDVASETFIADGPLSKDVVAFSQPTENGGRLAREWFGQEYGWHVYVD
ncbi:hypothetical protein LTR66_013973 [Elasticomyces elasticus]|nr:hypothetical protein LTR66_013973 [Elasticomyces elasticus]KAK4988624.1 hypothetical protein LTR50_003807 [Elasticomyces elasticus]KAK5010690.1 hypothetical protein LTR28_008367 [Elasticomyces elasticus]